MKFKYTYSMCNSDYWKQSKRILPVLDYFLKSFNLNKEKTIITTYSQEGGKISKSTLGKINELLSTITSVVVCSLIF